jgi:hypothetical protein
VKLTDFIAAQRLTAIKPTADIRSRWASRIIARDLHTQGAAGAATYLRDYGKGISSGGEHRTCSQAAQANATNGCPEAPVCCRMSIFKALFAHGRDLTGTNEEARIAAAGPITALAQSVLIRAGVVHHDIEQVPTAWTTVQKQALVQKQQVEGREGEVWIRWDTRYLGGKAPGDVMVRTKYLTETEVVITDLTPSTVAGRPFSAIAVSARYPDGSLRPVGKVGTGFDAQDAAELADLVGRHPEGLRILVRHQGRTETGMLWHARFLRIIGPVGMAA